MGVTGSVIASGSVSVDGPASVSAGWLRWRSWGAADRRALLLHDAGSSSGTWWQVGPALAEAGWRVKAPDLPSHGASPRAEEPLTPQFVARWLVNELADRPLDLLIGQGFGAAIALALEQIGPPVRHLVLDDLPGPCGVDWAAEATALGERASHARRDSAGEYAKVRARHLGWADEDCRLTVGDLAHCCTTNVVAGLQRGAEWPWIEQAQPRCPTLLMAGPEPGGSGAGGVGAGTPSGAGTVGGRGSLLRGECREAARLIADAWVDHPGGPGAHRGRVEEWLRSITEFVV